jgi:hypothetical protein
MLSIGRFAAWRSVSRNVTRPFELAVAVYHAATIEGPVGWCPGTVTFSYRAGLSVLPGTAASAALNPIFE